MTPPPTDLTFATEIVSLLIGYAFGSLPFGLLLTRVAGLGDIRSIGSGNIGATNVLRTGRKDLAIATLLLDAAKGAAALIVVRMLAEGPNAEVLALIAGVGAVIGHNFPIWLQFKGGKGVATSIGFMIAALPIAGIFACVTWLAMAAIYRYSSLAALVALVMAPLYGYILGYPNHALAFLVLAVLGWGRHHANIARLVKGLEPKIGASKKTEPEAA
jgi:acyl phosphate:glycerol-3-phosphate acyltransferase